MRRQFWRILKPARFERDLADEIAFHLQRRAEELIAGGMPPKQALRQARVEFGATERVKDECREAHGFPLLETIAQDVRYALRGFRRSPGFVAVAVLSLAMAIGANTAIFSLLYDALYDRLPVKQPGELVQVLMSSPRGSRWSNLDYPEALPLAEPMTAFSGTVCWSPSEMNLHFARRAAERVKVQSVSGNYYATLGVTVYAGRPIQSTDDRKGAPPVAVLSYQYWQNKLGKDSSILGQTVSLNGVPHTVVGVALPFFFGLDRTEAPEVTVPLNAEPSPPGMFYLVGRLKPGVSLDQARSELNGQLGRMLENQKDLLATLSPDDKDRLLRTRVDVIPAGSGNWGLQIMFERPIRLLFLMVAVILAVACVNIADLMLGRAGARAREMGLRRALGAGRRRLVRQSLTESVLLSAMGGGLGLLFAMWLHRVLLAGIPWIKSSAMAFRLNEGVLGFTAAASVLCGILFGLAPALHGAGTELSSTSLSGGSAGRPGRTRAGRALIAVQVTASLVLVTGATLLVRSLHNLQTADAGFDRDHLLVMNVDLRQSRFQGPTAERVIGELTDRVMEIPGVRSAAVADGKAFPLGGYTKAIWVEGFGRDVSQSYYMNFNTIGPNFFATIGVPMLLGRDFEPRDASRTPEPVVVNDAMARKFYPNQNPLGRRIGDGLNRRGKYEIVGVVRDWRHAGLRKSDAPAIFHSLWQSIDGKSRFDAKRPLVLHARAFGDPAGVASAMRKEIQALDPNLVVYDVRTMNETVAESLASERTLALLATLFGGLALGLACIGLYGVTSYAVSRRTSEIAVRLAMGATRERVVRQILTQNLAPVLVGLAAGVPLALWAVRLARGIVFGVGIADPISFLTACLVLAATTAVAGLIPALRSARIDPARALKYE